MSERVARAWVGRKMRKYKCVLSAARARARAWAEKTPRWAPSVWACSPDAPYASFLPYFLISSLFFFAPSPFLFKTPSRGTERKRGTQIFRRVKYAFNLRAVRYSGRCYRLAGSTFCRASLLINKTQRTTTLVSFFFINIRWVLRRRNRDKESVPISD